MTDPIRLPGRLRADAPLVAAWLARARPSLTAGAAPWLLGDDVSDWQTVHWDQLPALDFYITKATEGYSYVASSFAPNREQARQRGAPSGLYHFADWGDVATEADHFIATVGQLGPMEFVVLDCEGSAFYADPAGKLPWIEAWCSRVESALGRQPSQTPLYMSDAFAKVMPASAAARPLYDASYPLSGSPDTWGVDWGSGPWPKVLLTQYTSTGHEPGIDGNVDLDISRLDLAAALGLGTPTPPEDDMPTAYAVVCRPGEDTPIPLVPPDSSGAVKFGPVYFSLSTFAAVEVQVIRITGTQVLGNDAGGLVQLQPGRKYSVQCAAGDGCMVVRNPAGGTNVPTVVTALVEVGAAS